MGDNSEGRRSDDLLRELERYLFTIVTEGGSGSLQFVAFIILGPEFSKVRKAGSETFDSSWFADLSALHTYNLERRQLQEVDDPFIADDSATQTQRLEGVMGAKCERPALVTSV